MFSAILSSGPIWTEILANSLGSILVTATKTFIISAIKDSVK